MSLRKFLRSKRPRVKLRKVDGGYKTTWPIVYYSKRYYKFIFIEKDFFSDGATWAIDIEDSIAWLIHDKCCVTGCWSDGTKMTNYQASTVISDILLEEWRPFRAVFWWPATFIGGGGKARENGMFWLKDNV